MKKQNNNKKNKLEIRNWKLAISFLLFLTFPLVTSKIIAQSVVGTTVIPPRLEITVKPGENKAQTIKVRNEAGTDQVFTTSVVDFIVNNDDGIPIKVDPDLNIDNRWAASSWIQVSEKNFKLKGGETKALSLVIMVPKNALPGGHYAMVLHSPDNESTLSGTGSSIKTQVGTLVYITVPGDIRQNAVVKSFTAPKFSEFGPIDFKSTIQNLSDIHIKPAGNIAITNMFGLNTANVKFNKDGTNIFPGKSRDFKDQLNKKWLFGRYKANLNAVYGSNEAVATAALVFWVIPWRLLILVGIALAIITVIILILKKKTGKKEDTQEKVDELEQELEALKKKYKDQ